MTAAEVKIELPDGAIEDGVVAVVSYVKPDGGMGYTVSERGGLPISKRLGLLELAKAEILHADPE